MGTVYCGVRNGDTEAGWEGKQRSGNILVLSNLNLILDERGSLCNP